MVVYTGNIRRKIQHATTHVVKRVRLVEVSISFLRGKVSRAEPYRGDQRGTTHPLKVKNGHNRVRTQGAVSREKKQQTSDSES